MIKVVPSSNITRVRQRATINAKYDRPSTYVLMPIILYFYIVTDKHIGNTDKAFYYSQYDVLQLFVVFYFDGSLTGALCLALIFLPIFTSLLSDDGHIDKQI
ncbi:hypothetical protein F5887DRAFT_4151 [Amanita rubescens]|nr:hypothetical protein F5887DRAFT_4151 [Amanita rubescens]